MKKKKEKKITIISTDHILTRKEIKNFEKDNPGYRLSFELRHPDFPLWFSIGSLIASIGLLILSIVMPIIRIIW